MWIIKAKKTCEFLKDLHRDDGLGIPDIHLTTNANEAKVYRTHTEATSVVSRLEDAGSTLKLAVVRTLGRTPN